MISQVHINIISVAVVVNADWPPNFFGIAFAIVAVMLIKLWILSTFASYPDDMQRERRAYEMNDRLNILSQVAIY